MLTFFDVGGNINTTRNCIQILKTYTKHKNVFYVGMRKIIRKRKVRIMKLGFIGTGNMASAIMGALAVPMSALRRTALTPLSHNPFQSRQRRWCRGSESASGICVPSCRKSRQSQSVQARHIACALRTAPSLLL